MLAALLLLTSAASAFDLQGHRGARGLAPENTIKGFEKALEIGVTTLEADVVVTDDDVLVLSHDLELNPQIVRGPEGAWLSPPTPALSNITFVDLARYDVGRINPASRYATQFNTQEPNDGSRIPKLDELFDLVKRSGKAARFNLETKLSPERPQLTPAPEAFAQLIVDAIRRAGVGNRATIQSFDWRTILASRKIAPEIETACLTTAATLKERNSNGERQPSLWLAGLDLAAFGYSIPRMVKAAGCGTWSPRYQEVASELVDEARGLGLKVVPWTINDPADIARIIDMKVDGIITDYPDRARDVMAARGIALPP